MRTGPMRRAVGRLSADLGKTLLGAAKLTGDIGAIPAAEILQLLASARRSGLLLVQTDSTQRALLFVDGGIAWATSSQPHERLHELLCRLDLADRATLILGRLVADPRGVLERQIAATVAGLVSEQRGSFTLYAAPGVALPAAPAFDTRTLLMRALCAAADASSPIQQPEEAFAFSF